jgi:hypothetical protein
MEMPVVFMEGKIMRSSLEIQFKATAKTSKATGIATSILTKNSENIFFIQF